MQKIINFFKSLFKRKSVDADTNEYQKYTKFVIPTNGMSKSQAKESVAKLMQSYKEDVNFDSESGEITVNGKPNIPFSKQIWIPSK